MGLRIDLHVHTRHHSPCSTIDPEKLVHQAVRVDDLPRDRAPVEVGGAFPQAEVLRPGLAEQRRDGPQEEPGTPRTLSRGETLS